MRGWGAITWNGSRLRPCSREIQTRTRARALFLAVVLVSGSSSRGFAVDGGSIVAVVGNATAVVDSDGVVAEAADRTIEPSRHCGGSGARCIVFRVGGTRRTPHLTVGKRFAG